MKHIMIVFAIIIKFRYDDNCIIDLIFKQLDSLQVCEQFKVELMKHIMIVFAMKFQNSENLEDIY